MPHYTIRDIDTDETENVIMKYDEFMQFLKDNPNKKQVFKFPGFGDPYRLGLKKPDDGFRDVLKEIKRNHPLQTGVNDF